ncbi:hypothetical protein, unknown function [Leishmania tarentolae]|uniref:Uncharacterized protein n=1 Tax=Leishmania tarentolae TaxID=5689 RepID=A0A640KQ47_LEITA|nr:hypothetical protein, unknown function [Leishmania tarentolae]
MKRFSQESLSSHSATSVASAVEGSTAVAGPFSVLQVELQRSDPLLRSFCEPVEHSRSSASTAAEVDDTDVPPLLGGDLAAPRSSSIISSHDASFYSSLMVSRAENPDGLESCRSRTGRNRILSSPGTAAERDAHEQPPSLEPSLSALRHRLVPSSADAQGTQEEVAPNAEQETASEQPASCSTALRAVKSDVAAAGPHGGGADEHHRSGSQAHSHNCLASTASDVKTLESLLDWRAHLSAWQQSVGAHESHNTDGNDTTVKHTPHDQASHETRGAPASRDEAPTLKGAQVSPRSECLHGCHIGYQRTSAASSSSPSTDAITPAESNAAGGDAIAITRNPRSLHSHPSSGAASHTEVVDVFSSMYSSSASSSHRRHPAHVGGHPWDTPLHTYLQKPFSTGENSVVQTPTAAHVTIIDSRIVKGGGPGKSGGRCGVRPPTLSSSQCLEIPGAEDHTLASSTAHRSPHNHSALLHGLERRQWVRSARPPPAHTPILLHASPAGSLDVCRSRDNWNNPHSGSGKSTASSMNFPRQHSRESSFSSATPRTPESWRHRVKAMPPTVKSLRDLVLDEDYQVFTVPVDEETNKAVVGFVSGVILLICLVFICAM